MLKINNSQKLSCNQSGQGRSSVGRGLACTHEGWNVVATRPLGISETLLLKMGQDEKMCLLTNSEN